MGWRDTIKDGDTPKKGTWRDTISEEKPANNGPGIKETLIRGTTKTFPYVGGAAAGLLTAEGGPLAVPASALGFAGGKELERLANHYLLGDEISPAGVGDEAVRVGGNVAEGAMNAMGGKLISAATPKAASLLKPQLEKIATSPIPNKIAQKWDVSSKGKDALVGLTEKIGIQVPEPLKGLLNVSGRAASYSFKPTAVMQGVSDAARVVGVGQKGLAMGVDKIPPMLQASPIEPSYLIAALLADQARKDKKKD